MPAMSDPEARYQAAVGTAIVAAAFSLVIAVFLLVQYARTLSTGPLDSPAIAGLKAELRQNAVDDGLKARIRDLDLQLRQDFFRRRGALRSGALLLLAGCVIFVLALHAAAAVRRKPPMPGPAGNPVSEWRARTTTRAVVLAAAGAIAAVAVVAVTAASPDLRLRWAQAVTARAPVPEGASPASRPDLAPTSHPTDEAMADDPLAAPEPAAGEGAAGQWPSFRGGGGTGIAVGTNYPVTWDGAKGTGIRWKTPLALNGKNSPVAWGNRVFVTGADAKARKVYAFDADSGRLLWEREPQGITRDNAEAPSILDDTGFAAPTAATDGARVYAVFANGDLAAFDFAGKQVWAMNLGLPENAYGHAASLAVWRQRLLVQWDQGGADEGKSRLYAIDGATGTNVWDTLRPVGNSWASPSVGRVGEREMIVTCANPWVIAYEPEGGSELWRAECMGGEVAPSPVMVDGVVYAANQGAVLAAIKADGRGDITGSNILWKATDGLPDICSPLSDGKVVVLLTTGGLLTAYRASDGQKLWEKEFNTSFFASPALAGGLLYLLSEDGMTIVAEAGAQFTERHRSRIDDKFYACPAFANGRIYLRGTKNLYCLEAAR